MEPDPLATPADSVKAPTPKEQHSLSASEARKLLETAQEEQARSPLHARRSPHRHEAGRLYRLGLKWPDVDLENATVKGAPDADTHRQR